MFTGEIESRRQRIMSVFAREPDVVAAYLFGSVCKDRATPFSDVDFAVLLRAGAATGLELFALLDRLACALAEVLGLPDQAIDIVPLNSAGLVFQHFVVGCGRVVYDAHPKTRRLFEWRVVCRFLDYKPTLDIYDRARRKRLIRA
jgi:predicted nucleotidyltransferase